MKKTTPKFVLDEILMFFEFIDQLKLLIFLIQYKLPMEIS